MRPSVVHSSRTSRPVKAPAAVSQALATPAINPLAPEHNQRRMTPANVPVLMDEDDLLKAPGVQRWTEIQLQEVMSAYPGWDPQWETIEEHLIRLQEEALFSEELAHENQEEIYLDGEIPNRDTTKGAALELHMAGKHWEVPPVKAYPDNGS